MTRWKAALIHIGISATVAAIACLLLLFVWYPPPYFHAAGAERLMLLIVGVDVTLGPLLTFIVFKSGKPGLKFDLACIGTVQAIALIYGFHMMLASRPVFLVASVDRFVLVAANELDAKDVAAASRPAWAHLSWSGPVLVATQRPSDPKQRDALLWSGIAGKDIEKFPRYYVDYAKAAAGLLQRARPLATLRAMHPSHAAELDAWLTKHHRDGKGIVWLPIVARDDDLCMLLDKASGQPLGAVAMDPWQADPS
ncbi:MAG TPA: TfpX/TfpZ family type IV pilin accessory protein [Rhodanobacteraceae bacterium]|nr:TfpX/TfpZ family type IV pilin accessory protein [Rhodanobacteraceae bacterium]